MGSGAGQGVQVARTLKAAFAEARKDNITGEGAKAAYYFFLSLFPLLLAAFAFAGFLGPSAFNTLMTWIRQSVPPEAGAILADVVSEITRDKKPGALTFGILMTIYSASNFFAAIGDGLDTMFEVAPAKWWKKRLKAIGMMFSAGILLGVGGALIVAGPAIFEKLGLGIVFVVLRWPIVLAIIVGVFFLLYFILPDRDHRHVKRELLLGAVAGAVMWIVATALFRIYVSNMGNYGAAYGSLGGVIVMLLWLYLSAVAILFGGEVADALMCRSGPYAKTPGDGSSRDGAPGAPAPPGTAAAGSGSEEKYETAKATRIVRAPTAFQHSRGITMDINDTAHALPPGPHAAHGRPSLPPGAPGPLHKGARQLAGLLERAGQDGGAEYLRALDVDAADEKLQDGVLRLESGVRQKPLKSVAAALFAGFVVGRILR